MHSVFGWLVKSEIERIYRFAIFTVKIKIAIYFLSLWRFHGTNCASKYSVHTKNQLWCSESRKGNHFMSYKTGSMRKKKYFFHQVICSMIRLMSIFSADKMV